MALSWNEIKTRAVEFSKEWEDDFDERAEAKSFMDAFFNVFGIARRRVATFETHVRKEDGQRGFIDCLWKGNILIEFKSRGKDLDRAHQQAKDYFPGLRDSDLPKFILVCDFARFRLYDLEDDTTVEFKLGELVNNVRHFGYLLGYQKKIYKAQDPANIKAAELMGKLHDRLKEIGYTGHKLEIYLVRLLFCLFAEDTTIFNKQQFQDFIEQRTSEDGSDLAGRLQELFQVLNTPKESRFANLDEQLAEFAYVNGKLFEEILPSASFDTKMRQALLDCCYLDWSRISPAIFGAMFQSVMNPVERRNLGAHYTSETNILKLIKPLFLDDLWKEFESVKHSKNKLNEFHRRLSLLKFLDPACGCGNFLVITYRELRLLEIEILRALHVKVATEKTTSAFLNIGEAIWLDVDQFYGIELEEFPARIAEVAMWLIDHQMNQLISNEFGQYFVRLPLKKSATIIHENALGIDWENVVPKNDLSYILGNPPFVGKHLQTKEQKASLATVCTGIRNHSDLDYVSAWYIKAAQFIQGTSIKVGFVSTNSIVQGEQVSILWGELFARYAIKIHFAHQTFKWTNEARGKAAVYCVIIGFTNFDSANKRIFEYEDIRGQAHEVTARNINAYLRDAKDILIEKRQFPICDVPKMIYGNKPTDDGNFVFSDEEKAAFLKTEPGAEKFFRKYVGAVEFIHNKSRWCLWLQGTSPRDVRELPKVLERISRVKLFREKSSAEPTRKAASYPQLFFYISQPETDYLVMPETSSENRRYIPVGYMRKEIIASNLLYLIPSASLYVFGCLTSLMHMAWVKTVCGRLKSDFRYTGSIVYNNFPWPENPTQKQIAAIETAAQQVLDVRDQFPNSSLADLYDPLTMPPILVKAHNELDKAVDLAYRPQPFTSEANRMVFLFELYEKYTAGLFNNTKKRTRRK